MLEPTIVSASSLLSINEVSKYLEIGIQEIEQLANSGNIPGIKNGNHWEFERIKIDNWATSAKLK